MQHAVAQAVLVVVRKAQRFTGRGLGLSRAGSDARQARPRRASRSRGRSGLQKAATAEHGAPRFLPHTILLLSCAIGVLGRRRIVACLQPMPSIPFRPLVGIGFWVQSTKRQQEKHCPLPDPVA